VLKEGRVGKDFQVQETERKSKEWHSSKLRKMMGLQMNARSSKVNPDYDRLFDVGNVGGGCDGASFGGFTRN